MYISVVTGVVTFSIMCTILISQLHHRGEVAIPYSLRRFTFDFLASAVFLKQLKYTHGTGIHLPQKAQRSGSSTWSNRLSTASSTVKLKLLNGGNSIHDSLPRSNGMSPITPDSDISKFEMSRGETNAANTKILQSIDNHLHQVIECLSEYESRRIEATTSEFMKEEWQAVGKVYDRFFFLIFVIVMIMVTVRFLFPAFSSPPYDYPSQDSDHFPVK